MDQELIRCIDRAYEVIHRWPETQQVRIRWSEAPAPVRRHIRVVALRWILLPEADVRCDASGAIDTTVLATVVSRSTTVSGAAPVAIQLTPEDGADSWVGLSWQATLSTTSFTTALSVERAGGARNESLSTVQAQLSFSEDGRVELMVEVLLASGAEQPRIHAVTYAGQWRPLARMR
jgi:hypothetical protein